MKSKATPAPQSSRGRSSSGGQSRAGKVNVTYGHNYDRAGSDAAQSLLLNLDSNIRQLKKLSRKLGFMIDEVQESTARD